MALIKEYITYFAWTFLKSAKFEKAIFKKAAKYNAFKKHAK